MFSTAGHLFWGYAEWSLVFKYFGTFGKIVGSASLVNSPFPTILQNSGLQTENFVLFTYILKNKAQTQIFDFSNLYKPLSISSANWMLLLCLGTRISSGIYIRYFSITIRWKGHTGFYRIQINPLPHQIRWKGRTAFTESKSIHFHTRFAGRVAQAFTESKSIHFHTRFAGRVAPAFTESKSIHFHTRFAGRVAPAFTESKSIHFQTNLSGASRNNWYYSVGYWCNGTNLAYILPKICIISL